MPDYSKVIDARVSTLRQLIRAAGKKEEDADAKAKDIMLKCLNLSLTEGVPLTGENILNNRVAANDISSALAGVLLDDARRDVVLNTVTKPGPRPLSRFQQLGTLGTPLNSPGVSEWLGTRRGTLFSIRGIDASDTDLRGTLVTLGDSTKNLNQMLGAVSDGATTRLFISDLAPSTWLSPDQQVVLQGDKEDDPRSPDDIAKLGYSMMGVEPSVLVGNLGTTQKLAFWIAAGESKGNDLETIRLEYGRSLTHTYALYRGHIRRIAQKIAKRDKNGTILGSLDDSEQIVVTHIRESGCLPADPVNLLEFTKKYLVIPNQTASLNFARRDSQFLSSFINCIYDLFKMAGLHGLYKFNYKFDIDEIVRDEGVTVNSVTGPGQVSENNYLQRNPYIFISTPTFYLFPRTNVIERGKVLDEEPKEGRFRDTFKAILDRRINALLDFLKRKLKYGLESFRRGEPAQISGIDYWEKILAERNQIIDVQKKAKGTSAPQPNPWAWIVSDEAPEDKKFSRWFPFKADQYFQNYVGGRLQYLRECLLKDVKPLPLSDPLGLYCLFIEVQYLLSFYFQKSASSSLEIDINTIIGEIASLFSPISDTSCLRVVSDVVKSLLKGDYAGEVTRNMDALAKFQAMWGKPKKKMTWHKANLPPFVGNPEAITRAAIANNQWGEFLLALFDWGCAHPKQVVEVPPVGTRLEFLPKLWHTPVIFNSLASLFPLKIRLAYFFRFHFIPVPPCVVDIVPAEWLSCVGGMDQVKRERVRDFAEVLARAKGGKLRISGGKCPVTVDDFHTSLRDAIAELEGIKFDPAKKDFVPMGKNLGGGLIEDRPEEDVISVRDFYDSNILHKFDKDMWYMHCRQKKSRGSNAIYNRQTQVAEYANVKLNSPESAPMVLSQLVDAGDDRFDQIRTNRAKYHKIDEILADTLRGNFPQFAQFLFLGITPVGALVRATKDILKQGVGLVSYVAMDARSKEFRNLCDRLKSNGQFLEPTIGEHMNRMALRSRLRMLEGLFAKKYANPNDAEKLRVVMRLVRAGLLLYIADPKYVQGFRDLFGEDVQLVGQIAVDVQSDSNVMGELGKITAINPVALPASGSSFLSALAKSLVLHHEGELADLLQQKSDKEKKTSNGKKKKSKLDEIIASTRGHIAKLLQFAYAFEYALSANALEEFAVFLKLPEANFPVLAPIKGFRQTIAEHVAGRINKQDVKQYLQNTEVREDINKVPQIAKIKDLESCFYKTFANTHKHYIGQVGEFLAVLATVQLYHGQQQGPNAQKFYDDFSDTVNKAWVSRRKLALERKMQLDEKQEKAKGEGEEEEDVKTSPIPPNVAEDIFASLKAGIHFQAPEVEFIPESKPIPVDFSSFQPTLGDIDGFANITRNITTLGDKSIKFTLVGPPIRRVSPLERAKLIEEDKYDAFYDIAVYDDLFGNRDWNRLRPESCLPPRPPRKRRCFKYTEWKKTLELEIGKIEGRVDILLTEMHSARDKERAIKIPCRHLERLIRRRDIIKTYLLKEMNDCRWRGASTKEGENGEPKIVIPRHLDALNGVLLPKRLPLIKFNVDELKEYLGSLADLMPEQFYVSEGPVQPPIVGGVTGAIKSVMGGAQPKEKESLEKVIKKVEDKIRWDAKTLTEFQEIFLEMARIYKSPHLGPKAREEKYKNSLKNEHDQIDGYVERLYGKEIDDQRKFLADALGQTQDGKAEDLISGAAVELKRYDQYIRDRGADKARETRNLAYLRRLAVRSDVVVVQEDKERTNRYDRKIRAYNYLFSEKCPHYRKEAVNNPALPYKIHLKDNLIRKFQQGGILKGLKILPPDPVSKHMVASVTIKYVPAGDNAPPEPWFVTLAGIQRNDKDMAFLSTGARCVDVNQLNCWRPFAHGILLPPGEEGKTIRKEYAPWMTEDSQDIDADISVLDLAILTDMYNFKKGEVNAYEGLEKKGADGRFKKNSDGSIKTQRIVPALRHFWKIRRLLIQADAPEAIPDEWNNKNTDLAKLYPFKCPSGQSLLRLPVLAAPYDTGQTTKSQAVKKAATFNDQANAIPYYRGDSRAHVGRHRNEVQSKLDKLVALVFPAGTRGEPPSAAEARERYRDAAWAQTKYQTLLRKLKNVLLLLGRRETSLRDSAIEFLSRFDAYMSLRFPTEVVVYEDITFRAAGLTGAIGVAVKGMPKDFGKMRDRTRANFSRAKLLGSANSKDEGVQPSQKIKSDSKPPKYIAVHAAGTSQACFQHYWEGGLVDRRSSANIGVDDVGTGDGTNGHILDCHVNATWIMGLRYFLNIRPDEEGEEEGD